MKQAQYPFPIQPLPYGYEALEPYISQSTLYYHHDKHYKTYVENLNKALEGYPQFHHTPLVELLCNLDKIPAEIRTEVQHNGGGVYNHQLYFNSMSKPTEGANLPHGELSEQIEANFGSFSAFQAKLKQASLGQFGSGYGWLVYDNGALKITQTPNQNIPPLWCEQPLLPIDVWEHAYYLDYQNRRGDYIDGFFAVIDWEKIAKRLQKIKQEIK